MADSDFRRRREQLLDRFLAGDIDKATYHEMLAELERLAREAAAPPDDLRPVSPGNTGGLSEVQPTLVRATPVLTPNVEVGGFQVERLLGRGGMGEVWKALDPIGERHVVIKVLPPAYQQSPAEIGRLRETFQRIHALQHQHICPVYLLGEDPRYGFFLVMKYLEGEVLSLYRRRHVQQHGAVSVADLERLLMPVAQALDYAHDQRVVHRDIKPENIMVLRDGADVQVLDFGLAAEIRMTVTRVSQVRMDTSGTGAYMAPEQWRGGYQDGRSDQYALGVVAYELLSGRLPFDAPDDFVMRQCVLNEPVPVVAGQAPYINDIFARAMAKSRQERFPSCAAFVEEFSVAEAAQQALAKRPAPPAAAATGPAPATAPPVRFDVVLESHGNRPIDVILAVRAATGLDTEAAKKLVLAAPGTLAAGVSAREAAQLKVRLERAGAIVGLRVSAT